MSIDIFYSNHYTESFWLESLKMVTEYTVNPQALVTPLKNKGFMELRGQ